VDAQWWFQLAKEGGAFVAPFLLGAIAWQEIERKRLLAENKEKDDRLVKLSEQFITVATEMKTFLFNERKAS
jgi:hypothetical protein